MGFQSNSTLITALWLYKPTDPNGKEFCINLNAIHYIEATADHNSVWIFFPDTGRAGTQGPYQLVGAVAQQFMSDLEGIFT